MRPTVPLRSFPLFAKFLPSFLLSSMLQWSFVTEVLLSVLFWTDAVGRKGSRALVLLCILGINLVETSECYKDRGGKMRETGCISFSTVIIQHLDQNQLEGEGFILAHRLQSTTREAKVGIQDPGYRSSNKHSREVLLTGLLLLACSARFLIIQYHLPRSSTAHSGFGLSTSIFNQENAHRLI